MTTPERTLSIPMSRYRIAQIPFPLTEEDFEMLWATLALWKKRMLQREEESE